MKVRLLKNNEIAVEASESIVVGFGLGRRLKPTLLMKNDVTIEVSESIPVRFGLGHSQECLCY